MPSQPYVARLSDGRYLAVELPEGSAETDPITGEVILRAPAIHLLDHLRALLTPLPGRVTPARLRILREGLGLSPAELAAQLQVPADQIIEWESGRSMPESQQLAALETLRRRAARTGVVLQEP